MRLLGFLFLGGMLLAQQKAPQNHEKGRQVQDQQSNDNQYRQRGQIHPADQSQSWTRGRLGTQHPIPGKIADISGVLVDASCQDRSEYNLTRAAEPPNLAAAGSAERSAPAAATPADAFAHQTPDMVTRQGDRGCAVTGATRGYALLTPEGRLLNLDEGGNTFVSQALQSNPAGRAMLNGAGPGLKPQVTLRGRVQGDRVLVEKIVKM